MEAAVQHRVSFLPNYPARSPDLNPIENLFSKLDRYLMQRQAQDGDAANENAFMQRVRAFFALDSTRVHILNLADSMPARGDR